MKKRILSTLLILTISCTSLVGCKFSISIGDTSKNESNSEQKKDNTIKNKEYSKEKITEDNNEENIIDKNKEENTSDEIITENVGVSNWKDYQVLVGSTKVNLPCSYQDIAQVMNAKMKDTDEKSYLESNYYTTCTLYSNDKITLYIQVLNDTNTDKTLADCKVTRISQTKSQVERYGAKEVIFPGDLKVGMSISENELKSKFGEPAKVYNGDNNYNKYTWAEDQNWKTNNNIEVTVVNGVIDEISLDHRNY